MYCSYVYVFSMNKILLNQLRLFSKYELRNLSVGTQEFECPTSACVRSQFGKAVKNYNVTAAHKDFKTEKRKWHFKEVLCIFETVYLTRSKQQINSVRVYRRHKSYTM